MKKMSNKNIMSVIDAMLNVGVTLIRLLNIGDYSSSLTISMKVKDFASISLTTLSTLATR
jgi:hypothetical protein